MDRSLSPFVDHVSLNGGTPSRNGDVGRLQYEVSALKTEKRLLKQSRDSAIAKYEELLAKKSEELAALQGNFDYVYNRRKDLELKLQNQKDVADKASGDLAKEVKTLRTENRTLSSKLAKYERLYLNVTGKCDHLRADLNRELAANDQYREQVKVLETEIARLSTLNDELSERLGVASTQIDNGINEKKVADLQLRLVSLQKTNNHLQLKVDQLLQQKTSAELLKQKNASLSSRLQTLEGAEERASQLELANLELQAKFDEYFGVIASTVDQLGSSENVVLDFVKQFRMLQNKNLVLYDKLNESQASVNELESEKLALQMKINDTSAQIQSRDKTASELHAKISELEKMKIFNSKEIAFLRKSLKDMDRVTHHQQLIKNNIGGTAPVDMAKQESERNATSQYLTNLEKLVDEYKSEIETLRKSSSRSDAPIVPAKRPRLLDEDTSSVKAAAAMRNENIELLGKVKSLSSELALLQNRLKLAEESSRRLSQGGRILEHRSNPFANDQLIKREQLDLLKAENEELVAKYITGKDVDMVPRSIFARQENDKELLQTKLDQLAKKINRLKCVYADKSKEIIAIISRYFGYNVEFIANPINPNVLCSKIKLVPKYMLQANKETTPPYLILDLQTKSLKANGDYEFKNICEDLVSQWVSEKNQIPCFLSALNLKVYNEYVKGTPQA